MAYASFSENFFRFETHFFNFGPILMGSHLTDTKKPIAYPDGQFYAEHLEKKIISKRQLFWKLGRP